MSAVVLFSVVAAAMVGMGLFGVVMHTKPVRRVLALKLLGAGVFLAFGVVARRGGGAGSGFLADPVPQAIVITGIIVALASSAFGKWLMVRLAAAEAAPEAE